MKGKVAFFDELKLKDLELKEIGHALQISEVEARKAVCRFGQKGDSFYILMKGKISIWVPYQPAQMIKYLDALVEEIKDNPLEISNPKYKFGVCCQK